MIKIDVKRYNGTEKEQEYLQNRLTMLSIKEQELFAGAIQIEKAKTAPELINIVNQLDHFSYLYGPTDNESLGKYVAKYVEELNDTAKSFVDMEQLGEAYQEQNEGVFVQNGFVVPDQSMVAIYNGENLAALEENYSIKIKLASKDCPEGVWVNLPDDERSTLQADEMKITLDYLQVSKLYQCALLDAKCCFENITDIAEQYDSLENLINDANHFGYVYEERGQGQTNFLEHWQAAMALEGCTKLDDAIDISQNLHCYDFVARAMGLATYGYELVVKNNVIHPSSIVVDCFDFEGYALSQMDSVTMIETEHGYVARNRNDFCYEFSQAPNDMKISR